MLLYPRQGTGPPSATARSAVDDAAPTAKPRVDAAVLGEYDMTGER